MNRALVDDGSSAAGLEAPEDTIPAPSSSPLVTEPTRFFAAWRSLSLDGNRDVIDGIVAPSHRGPSRELTGFLARWPGAWYWGDDAHSRLVLIRGTAPARPERWLWHGALLVLTIICTLGAGVVLMGGWTPVIQPGLAGTIGGVIAFAEFVVHGGWRQLLPGWEFAAPLLLILLVHELGHYVAARRYAIDVSPPYFLPVPPNISPIGGFGAFIRLRSPVYDRRQLLDVGAAGPLAGFIMAFVVLIWGYGLSQRLPFSMPDAPSFVSFAGRPFALGESLLTRALREWMLPGSGPVRLSPEAFAGWVGMFITGLNLLPLSQLDGGHVLYGRVAAAESHRSRRGRWPPLPPRSGPDVAPLGGTHVRDWWRTVDPPGGRHSGAPGAARRPAHRCGLHRGIRPDVRAVPLCTLRLHDRTRSDGPASP